VSKVSQQEVKDQAAQTYFPTLLNGLESAECVALRQKLYEQSWQKVESKIETILAEANEKTLSQVTSFLESSNDITGNVIPTGLIVTGPNIASQELLFTQLENRVRSDLGSIVVTFRSSDASNLKTVLKKLIRDATNQDHGDDDEQAPSSSGKQKLLNYDLQILRNHLSATSKSSTKVVVAFQDSEAFDSELLTELILLFKSWLDRINFVVLFGIATSIELFHERLPRSAILCMHGTHFDVEQTNKTLLKVFDSIVLSPDTPLTLGPNFISALIEHQNEHVQSLHTFVSALKYAYMSHFYGNPLSFLFNHSVDEYSDLGITELLQPQHFESLRTLPSFKRRVEAKLLGKEHDPSVDWLNRDEEESSADAIIAWLESDERLAKFLSYEGINIRYNNLKANESCIRVLSAAMTSIGGKPDLVDLYIKLYSGKLANSDIMQSLVDGCKRLQAADLLRLITTIIDEEGKYYSMHESFDALKNELVELIEQAEAAGKPLQSRYTMHTSNMRTTITGQKITLAKATANQISNLDRDFSDWIDNLSASLKSMVTKRKLPQDLLLHEIWFYDSRYPYSPTFTPRPRQAIERALSTPHDYLGCSCCSSAASGGLSGTQPPTAVLYQLYLETGGLINVYDLWSAFLAIMKKEDAEKEEQGEQEQDREERRVLMLFYSSLAELKLLGMVKHSRKKTDHVAKLAWKGL
jgi:origin recognition complex subunit 3